MKVRAISEQEIRNAKCRGYNPSAWDATIDRFLGYQDCQFYIEVDGPYEYERFFATYQILEGMRLFKSVAYSSVISNAGFCRIEILEDGTIQKNLFTDSDGKEGYAANEPTNRKLLAMHSIKFGDIFTNTL